MRKLLFRLRNKKGDVPYLEWIGWIAAGAGAVAFGIPLIKGALGNAFQHLANALEAFVKSIAFLKP